MLRHFVKSIVSDRIQDTNGLPGEAMVGWRGNTRVGTAIITNTEKNDNSIELAVIIVKKEYQGYGFGRLILDALLNCWLPYKTVYARCFPVSEMLAQMLLHRDFAIARITDSGTRILGRQQETRPEHGRDSPIFRAA